MNTQTVGVKLDISTRKRLKEAAAKLDRTSHWFIKQAIQCLIKKVESGVTVEQIVGIDNVEADIARHSVLSRQAHHGGQPD